MAKIQGSNVLTMAGEAVLTRETRRAKCAWLYSQSRAVGTAGGGVGRRGGFFPRQRKAGRECRNRVAVSVGGIEIE